MGTVGILPWPSTRFVNQFSIDVSYICALHARWNVRLGQISPCLCAGLIVETEFVEKELFEMQAAICQALAHPVRQRILSILSKGHCTQTELLKQLQIPKANLSQHLSLMKETGIVDVRREGKFHICSIGMAEVKTACELVRSILISKLDEKQKRMHELRSAAAKLS